MDSRLRSDGRTPPELSVKGSILDRAREVPRLLVLLLLLCFVVQGTEVQSHVHFVRQAVSLTVASGNAQVEATPAGKSDSPADCPLCRESAMAGDYVLPSAPVLPPPPEQVLWNAAAVLAAFTLLAPPLGWLSRAPPE